MCEFDPHSSHPKRYAFSSDRQRDEYNPEDRSYLEFRDDLEFYDYSDCKGIEFKGKSFTFEELFNQTMARLDLKERMERIRKLQLDALKKLINEPDFAGVWRDE